MSGGAMRPLPRVFAILLVAAGALGALRTGAAVSAWLFYRLGGTGAVAAVERCERYEYVVRKPRPSRYVTAYRGAYTATRVAGDGAPVRVAGRFDTRDFLGAAGDSCRVGDALPIVVSRLAPARSRPAATLRAVHLLVPGLLFALSLGTLALGAVLARLLPAAPGPTHSGRV